MTTAPPSAPAKRRARRKAARPAEILAAALAVFARRGFAAARLEEVAAAAGIGKGTIYLYFPNKEELFRAVVRERLLPNLDEIEALVAAHRGSQAELLRQIGARLGRLIDSELVALPRLVLAESGNFPGLARFYVDEVVKRGVALFATVIRRGVTNGEFRPVEPLAVLPLFAGPFAVLALWQSVLRPYADFSFDPALVVQTHLEVLLRGLAAEAPA
jgi:AcrR family transcriptional regulator